MSAWIVEGLCAGLLVGASVWTVWGVRAGRGLRWRWFLGLLLLGGSVGGAAWAVRSEARQVRGEVRAATPLEPRAPFVGSRACKSCHPGAWHTWHETYHRTMTQRASDTTVQGVFDGRVLSRGGVAYRVHRDGPRFLATRMAGPPWRAVGPPQQVVQTTGSHHRQIYWLVPRDAANAGNRLEMLPFLWYGVERRWMLRVHGFVAPERQSLQLATWNDRCVHCHTTGGAPRARAGGHDTEVGELGIGCESCHGPGDAHVAHWRSPVGRMRRRLSTAAEGDAPHRLVSPEDATPIQVNSLCGQCHSIGDRQGEHWTNEGSRFRAGGDLREDRLLARRSDFLRTDPHMPAEVQKLQRMMGVHQARKRYWSDGQPRVTGRELSQQRESPCSKGQQITCLSCHSMHGTNPNDLLRRDPDAACQGCHKAKDAEAHHHHAPGSVGARCVGCHMPKTTWGLLKAVRSHAVTSPDLAVSLETGRPDACGTCHMDRPLPWIDRHLTAWYGRAPTTLTADQAALPVGAWRALVGDPGVRALTARHFGAPEASRASGGGWALRWLAELIADPYPAVRIAAAASVRALTGLESLPHERSSAPEELAKRRAVVLELWRASRTPGAAPDAALIERLTGQRDQRPLTLAE